MFKEYIGKLKDMVGEERTNFILSKGLIFVAQGSNDISNTYSVIRKAQYDFPHYSDLLVNWASSFFKVNSSSLSHYLATAYKSYDYLINKQIPGVV